MPLASSISSRLSPSMPSKHIFTVPGTWCSRLPLILLWGILDSSANSLSRMAIIFLLSSSILSTDSFRAAAMATIPATFSVPARLPRSWAPPSIRLNRGMFFRQYRAPTPLGAWNLWPEMDSISMFIFSTSMGMWPAACTASVWKGMPFSRHRAPISVMGCTVPISLLANMMVTRQVSSRMAAATSSSRTTPSSCTSSRVTS